MKCQRVVDVGPDTRILEGDCREVLKDVGPGSIQCCVTSPPYWGLRDYDHELQIGAEPTPIGYIQNLVDAFREVRRVLTEDGTLWLNVGDGYARNGGTGSCGPNAQVGNTKKLVQRRNCKVPDCWGLKDRDLMGLPWRVAFALQEDGWILRSHITWVKKAPMPESVRNRPSNATEAIFLFAKSPKYFYDNDGWRNRLVRTCGITGFWARTRILMGTQRRSHESWQEGAFALAARKETLSLIRFQDRVQPVPQHPS